MPSPGGTLDSWAGSSPADGSAKTRIGPGRIAVKDFLRDVVDAKARRQEYCRANPGTYMWNPAQPAPRFRSGGQLKKRLGSILLSGIALLTVCSAVVHPFGAIKAHRSDKPLLLDSTFSPQVVRTIESGVNP